MKWFIEKRNKMTQAYIKILYRKQSQFVQLILKRAMNWIENFGKREKNCNA